MSGPTRIKNNQITDATITYAKIAPGTLVGSLFNPDVTISSNISIQGNLTVTGTTSTVNSVDTLVQDPLVIFNNRSVGTPTYDVGILVNRSLSTSGTGIGVNAGWVWREANVGFAGMLTTETGTTTGSINNSAYANLIIGNTTIEGQSVNSVNSTTGAFQVKGGVGIGGNMVLAGTSTTFGVTSGPATFSGNIPIVQVSQGSSTRYGFMVVDTNSGTGAHIIRVSPTGTNIGTIGGTVTTSDGTSGGNDIFIQPGRLKSLWLNGSNAAIMADNNLNSTSPNVGAIVVTGSGGIGIGGNLNVGTSIGAEMFGTLAHVVIQSARTNDIAIGKNTLKSGLGANSTVLGTMIGTTSVGSNATLVGAAAGPAATPANATYIGKSAGNLATGSDSTYVGYNSGSLVTTGQYNVILGSYDGNVIATLSNQVVVADGQGRPRIRVDAAGNVFVVSGLDSTSSNIGAFVVQGGAGIGGNLNVGGAASFAAGRVMLDASTTSLILAGNTYSSAATTNTGITVIGQGINLTAPVNIGASTTIMGYQALNTGSTGASQTLIGYRAGYTGSGTQTTAVGAQAGLLATGVGGQYFGYLAGSAITTGTYNTVIGANTGSSIASLSNYVIISDGQGNEKIRATNTGSVYIPANISSTGTSVGSLVVQGGIATAGLDNNFLGNVTIGGNLWVLGGTTAIQSNVLVVEDSTIQLHTFGDQRTLGANDLKDVGVIAHYYKTADKYAYFGWQNDSGNFVYMDSVTESTANVITGTYGNVQFGSAWLSNTTASGSQTSGALVVKGGIGAGALSYLNSLTVDNNLTASGSGALITFSPTGGGYVTINPATAGAMDNMAIGVSTPKAGSFTTLTATQNNFNVTLSPTGSGTVAISPAGALTISPTTTSNMDNVFIGNSTPRQASFTAATVGQDLKMSAFTANSALFISPASGNLSVDQSNENFNFQRATGNTFSGVSFSVGTGGDTATGTDTLNIRYQGDAYLATAGAGLTTANTLGQSSGWTVSTSRGAGTAPVINQDGDFIGVFGAYNYSGGTAAYQEASSWRYVTQGTTAAASGIGGQAQLWTKRDNGASTLAMRVDANQITTFYGQVAIANTTTTTNSTTGALYVAGGVSAGGNIVLAQGARFNDSQTSNRDFYVRGQNDATLIWGYTGAYNSVLIGNSATTGDLITGAKFQINSTDSMLLPRGTDTNRPGAGGTAGGYGSAVAGMLRFNTGRNDIEYYTGSTWYSPQTSQLTIVEDQQFNGDGNQVDFTTSREVLASAALVTINGVVQTPSISYTMSYYPSTLVANVVSFSEAPAVGDAIDIRSFTTTSTISRLASSNGFMTFEPRDTGIVISTGETQANISIVIQTDGAIAYTPGGVTIGTSPLVIDSFVKTTYRQAKYQIVVANSGNTQFETSEVMVIHDGTTAYRTQYNRIYTGAAALGTVTTSVVGANVYVYYTGVSSSNIVKTVASYIG